MIQILLGLIPMIIIVLIIFYSIKYLLNKFSFFKSRKILKIITSFLSSILVYLGGIYLLFSIILSSPKIEFDENLWKSNNKIRYQMVDDLLTSKKILNKSNDELINIIGNPTNKINDEVWEYEIFGSAGMDFKVIKLKIIFIDHKVSEVIKSENVF